MGPLYILLGDLSCSFSHYLPWINDPWTKPKLGRIEGGKWGVGGVGESDGGENGDNCT